MRVVTTTARSPETTQPTRRGLSPGLLILRDRLLTFIPTLFVASVVVFLVMQLVPGDPAILIVGEDASLEELETVREELGLNDPVPVQYVRWISGVVQLDLGESLVTGEPIWDTITRRFPRTLELLIGGMLVAVLFGVPMGILAALRVNRPTDSVVRAFSTTGLAIPNFWLGLIVVSILALGLGWFPATGLPPISEAPITSLRHLILPALTIGLTSGAIIARQTRSALLEVIGADFVRTLRAMGLKERLIVWQHALKNASIPVVTVIGLDVSRLVGGTVVIERVFGIPGLGSVMIEATAQRDFPVVQGTILVVVVMVLVINLLVDLAYLWLDPRTGGRGG